MWPADPSQKPNAPPSLVRRRRDAVDARQGALPAQLARWLDALDETGRWALLKLVTGGLRIGVSARLAKTAAAALGDKEPNEIEMLWPGLAPPYVELFAWLEGRADKPVIARPGAVPPRHAGARHRGDRFRRARSARTSWRNGNGTASACRRSPASTTDGQRRDAALFAHRRGHLQELSRSGRGAAAARRDRRRAADHARGPRAVVQRAAAAAQPQDRDAEADRGISRASARLRSPGRGRRGSARAAVRRAARAAAKPSSRSSTIRASISRRSLPFDTWDELTAARADPAEAGAGRRCRGGRRRHAQAPRRAPTCPGRPKGLWWKWKRDPFIVDAVLMYAQRGHGKRSSYYSDYTFGVWTAGESGDELVPVGKAYFGFTDEELLADRPLRAQQHRRPVRPGARGDARRRTRGWCSRWRSRACSARRGTSPGVAMRFPRISRLRWDKPPREADRLETLEKMLAADRERTRRRNRRAGHGGSAPSDDEIVLDSAGSGDSHG